MALLKRPAAVGAKRKILGTAKPAVKRPARATSDFGDEGEHQVSSTGAFAAARGERKKQELERLKPWNLSVPVGKTMEVYILDKGEPWKRYEHSIGGGPNSRAKTYPCIKDTNEVCPICNKEGKEGAFVMYLTCVVPIDKYEKADGEVVTRRFQKKLFPIKTKMSAKYERLYQKHGNLRGAVLRVSRDQKMDAATGSDVEFVKRLSERVIADYAAAENFKGETKEQITKAKISEPFDYEKVMPAPKAKELAAMVGMRGGSSIGSTDFEDEDDTGGGVEANWGAE
jgi:hypothetical protein